MIADRNLYLAEDGETVVEMDDERQRTLLVHEGCYISDEDAKKYGITAFKVKKSKGDAGATSADAPPADAANPANPAKPGDPDGPVPGEPAKILDMPESRIPPPTLPIDHAPDVAPTTISTPDAAPSASDATAAGDAAAPDVSNTSKVGK